MELKKEKRLFQGRSKKVYATGDPEHIILVFMDESAPFESGQPLRIRNRKKWACEISALLMKYVASYHIPTHFVQSGEPGEMVAERLNMIPAEFVIWNTASGSLSRRFGIKEGTDLSYPILECYLKDEALKYPMVSMDHLHAFDIAAPNETAAIDRMIRKINAVLKSYFERRRLKLVSTRLEFGRKEDRVVLGDEITPETCLFWDGEQADSPSKARFRLTGEDRDAVYARLCGQILS